MLPEIEFRYSSIYDEIYRNSPDIKKILKRTNRKYPSREEIIDFIDKMNIIWKVYKNKILGEISKISGLKWSERKIICYVVGSCRIMSDPLTLCVYKEMDYALDALTHELIHQIQFHTDDKKWSKWLKYLDLKYPKYSEFAKSHVFVHAVHKEIYLELFDTRRWERNVEDSKNFSDYKVAWQMVKELGHNKIIKKFKQITK
ncbi:hypothetical protein J4416_02690 [Candidatus Pacearchaeota archaeon]|nr:hypothetical protein [Candidatus Pacearchaeota archaeon]